MIDNKEKRNPPVEGGIYRFLSDQIKIIAVGRDNNGEEIFITLNEDLSIMSYKLQAWSVIFDEAVLIAIDRSLLTKEERGTCLWLGKALFTIIKKQGKITLVEKNKKVFNSWTPTKH